MNSVENIWYLRSLEMICGYVMKLRVIFSCSTLGFLQSGKGCLFEEKRQKNRQFGRVLIGTFSPVCETEFVILDFEYQNQKNTFQIGCPLVPIYSKDFLKTERTCKKCVRYFFARSPKEIL